MSYYDGFAPVYTFHLCIARDDGEIIRTAITAKADPSEIAKAKKDIRRLLDAYSPKFPAHPAPAPDIPLPVAEPVEDTPAQDQAPKAKPEGARGLLRLRCPECGKNFGTYLKDPQPSVPCRCGHHIDLTAPLARYRFTCPYCEKETWGLTNLEDPDIVIRCKCGKDVGLRWMPDAKEYWTRKEERNGQAGTDSAF